MAPGGHDQMLKEDVLLVMTSRACAIIRHAQLQEACFLLAKSWP